MELLQNVPVLVKNMQNLTDLGNLDYQGRLLEHLYS